VKQCLAGLTDDIGGQARRRGDVVQAVQAVRLIQDPQQRVFEILRVVAARAPEEAAFAQPRLTVRQTAAEAVVAVNAAQNPCEPTDRLGERIGVDQVQVVGGCVVLGVFAVGRASEPTDGQVEAGRAELAFVISVR